MSKRKLQLSFDQDFLPNLRIERETWVLESFRMGKSLCFNRRPKELKRRKGIADSLFKLGLLSCYQFCLDLEKVSGKISN